MIWIIAGCIAALLGLLVFFMTGSPRTVARFLVIGVRPFFITLTCLAVLGGFWGAALPLYLITIAVIWFAPLSERPGDRARYSHRSYRSHRADRTDRAERTHRTHDAPRSQNQPMTLEEARRILKISPTASREDINAAYKRLMRDMHPDKGGSNKDAARLNEARDILFRHVSR